MAKRITPPLETLKVDVPEGTRGRWTIERFTVPKNDPAALRYALHGRPVPPGTYTRLMYGATDPMMSDTPAEITDHLEFLWMVEMPHVRRVLINGLGIGMCLGWTLKQPHIQHVDVVETDPDVVTLAGPHYRAMAERLGKTLEIHTADAFTAEWPLGTTWDLAWHDIWPAICPDNLEEMKALRRKYKRTAAWQGCWCERECRAMLHETRRRPPECEIRDPWLDKGLRHARQGRPAALHHYRGHAALSYAKGYLAGLEEDQLLERLDAQRTVQEGGR